MKTGIKVYCEKAFLFMRKLFLCFFVCVGLISCIDGSVDYKDLSYKTRLELDNVKLRLGTTERILLKDLLKVDSNVVKSDTNKILYWWHKGNSTAQFRVPTAKINIDANQLNINKNFGPLVWNEIKARLQASGIVVSDEMFPAGVSVPAYQSSEYIEFNDSKNFDLNIDLPTEVLSVSEIQFGELFFSVALQLNTSNQSNDVSKNLAIYGIKDIVIQMPDYIVSPNLNEQHQYVVTQQEFTEGRQLIQLQDLRVDRLKFVQALERGERLTNAFSISGKVRMGVKTPFTIQAVPEATIALVVKANNKQREELTVNKVKGRFAPQIEGLSQTFDIKQQMPKFLSDESSYLDLANPTLRLGVDLLSVPVGLQLQNAKVTTIQKQQQQSVTIASEGLRLPSFSKSQVYFYEGEKPYDPQLISKTAISSKVAGFNALLQRVPETLVFEVDNRALQLESSVSEIELGKNYQATVDYELFFPFMFDRKFYLQYTHEMYHGLDWTAIEEADLSVAGIAVSSVPLSCAFRLVFCDKDGNPLPTVEAEEVSIAAAKNNQESRTPFEIRVKTKGKDPLKNMYKIKYVLTGKNTEATTTILRNDQYLQLQDVRLYASGSLIHDYGQ